MSVSSRLSQVLNNSETKEINDDSRIIIFSDCHRGDNSWSDEFANNQNIYFHALNHYYDQGFSYVEAGDGEEMWENSKFEDIRYAHKNLYWLLGKFHKEGRLTMIWGNHNRKWSKSENVKKYLYTFYDERDQVVKDLFKNIKVHEGYVLHHKEKAIKIFITHGHQGDCLNDRFWWIGQFFVRTFWKLLQGFGFRDPTRPAKNYKIRRALETKIVEWSENQRQPIVVGHTHRPRFPNKAPWHYYNTVSCVHPRSITGIEITDGTISLIKWFIGVKKESGGQLFIIREVLVGPKKLTELF